MQINADVISYLENLSCLTLSDSEKQLMSGELKEILSYMSLLGELDTESIPERSHPFDNVNSFRDDEVERSLDRSLILKNAPRSDDEMFIAPKTVD